MRSKPAISAHTAMGIAMGLAGATLTGLVFMMMEEH